MPDVPSVERPEPVKWYYRPLWVLALLFVVLGPLGLPYLWKSPAFSRRMKVVLTVLEVVFLAFGIVEAVRMFHAVQEQMRALGGVDNL